MLLNYTIESILLNVFYISMHSFLLYTFYSFQHISMIFQRTIIILNVLIIFNIYYYIECYCNSNNILYLGYSFEYNLLH